MGFPKCTQHLALFGDLGRLDVQVTHARETGLDEHLNTVGEGLTGARLRNALCLDCLAGRLKRGLPEGTLLAGRVIRHLRVHEKSITVPPSYEQDYERARITFAASRRHTDTIPDAAEELVAVMELRVAFVASHTARERRWRPRPPIHPGQGSVEQSAPEYPLRQAQTPALQTPMLLQSLGQLRAAQPIPSHPARQKHVPAMQYPRPLQLFGQALRWQNFPANPSSHLHVPSS